MAAYFVAHLPPKDELDVLNKYFWSALHFNMFAFYVALTNGQHSTFKTFLSGGNEGIVISDQFLSDPLKCLRLFCCFHEVGNTKLCEAIENAKALNRENRKIIDLSDIRFSPSKLECVTLFLTSSSCKEWVGINFYRCYIQDQGICILHRRLHNSGISIDRLWLDCNGLTSSSFSLIVDIVLSCKVKILWIDSNNMVEGVEDFHSMLSEHSTLEKLHMTDTNLSLETAIKIFSALLANSNLRKLWITSNNVSDEASQTLQ